MSERLLMNDQTTIAGLVILVFACIMLGYWIRGTENESARSEPDPTEHGKASQ